MDMKDIKNLDKKQILDLLGLEEADSTLTSVLRALGFIGLGALLGATAMLFLAPQTGREMRENVAKRVKNSAHQAVSSARDKFEETQNTGG